MNINDLIKLNRGGEHISYNDLTDMLGLPREYAESQVGSGINFDFLNPTVEMIDISDISRSLWNIPRFNGHLNSYWSNGGEGRSFKDINLHWSVWHHAILVYRLVSETYNMPEFGLEALHHDSSEAYTGDIISPLKNLSLLRFVVKAIENGIEQCIAEKFGLQYPWPKVIKDADRLAQSIEAAMFKDNPADFLFVPGFEMTTYYSNMVWEVSHLPESYMSELTYKLMEERRPPVSRMVA